MTILGSTYAGLILPDARGLDTSDFIAAAKSALEKRDPLPGGKARLVKSCDTVHGDRYGVRVTPEPCSPYGPRVLLEVVSHTGRDCDSEDAIDILTETVIGALAVSSADLIEWCSPGTLVDRTEFFELTLKRGGIALPEALYRADANLSHTLRPALKIADVQNEQSAMSSRMEQIAEMPAEDRRMGTAGWLMTGVLAMVAFPVAASLAVVGLTRGMEFRLVAQVLAVTGLFVALQNTEFANHVLRQLWH